jgi:hypothetical protein
MSDGAIDVPPNGSDINLLADLLNLLADLLERAQQLPEGPDRTAVLLEIRDFQRRLAAILAAR